MLHPRHPAIEAFRPRAMTAYRAGPTGGMQFKADAAELLMYGPFGDYWDDSGITAAGVVAALAGLGDRPVVARINSPGGDVFEAIAVRNALAHHAPGVTVVVDGIAASAASYVALAGRSLRMHTMSALMIHRASTIAWGNDSDMLATAEVLAKIDGMMLDEYVRKTGGDPAALRAALDKETYYTAAEAHAAGFADEIIADPEPVPAPPSPDAMDAARLRMRARLAVAGVQI